MKGLITAIALLCTFCAQAQDTTAKCRRISKGFQPSQYMATLTGGFINDYRNDYSAPANFEKGTTTGMLPIQGRIEYNLGGRVSFGANAGYSTLRFNGYRIYEGFAGPIKREESEDWRIFRVGIGAYYHLGYLFRTNRFDPFIGAGINLNNIKTETHPYGDVATDATSHTITGSIKAGVRYYVSNSVSLYADAGYDRLSAITVGASCRFAKKGKTIDGTAR